ncbi:MAG: hypothetical protein K0R54_5544 [Clostridiaceae bacterium]|nr:hypothetical protein [Clostridiaceae bacterium]
MDNKTCKNLRYFLNIKEFVLRLLLDLTGIRTKINIWNARSFIIEYKGEMINEKLL